MNYLPPVNKLLSYGDCHDFKRRHNYLKLGFTREHVPELIKMATDIELNLSDSESAEVWAPVHAWRILGQLQAEEAIEPLIELFHELEDDDWVDDELPIVFGKIGVKAVPALTKYLNDTAHNCQAHTRAVNSLEKIASANPSVRNECVSILTQKLKRVTKNDPDLNGFIICYLLDLKAVESIKTIREAYKRKCVEIHIPGDIEAVKYELGFRESPPEYLKEFLQLMSESTNGKYKRRVEKNDPCPCGSGKKFEQCCLNKN